MAPPKTRSRDRSSLPKYRVELPILLDDMNLSVYAFRLYIHLKRVAERSDEGSCWESARTLATACNMSSGQVSKAKDELEQHGLVVRHIKMMRGGVGDDITIVDIWPQNFARYAPERAPVEESDHHTITSEQKVITTRSLPESDHQVITSEESDHTVIAETIKRSYSDPIDHDQYHIESDSITPTPTARERKNGVGVGESIFTKELIERGVNPKKAAEIASNGYDRPAILESLDNMLADGKAANRDRDLTIGNFINRLKLTPPEVGKPYTRQRATANGAPLIATRPNVPETTVSPSEMARRIRERQ